MLQKRIVPVDLLFSTAATTKSCDQPLDRSRIWQDVPIVNLEAHLDAVRSIATREGSIDAYLELELRRTGGETADRERILAGLYSQMSVFHRFFQRVYPVVARFERDRLVLAEGELTACIAKYRGLEWIKVLLPEDIAQRWDARPTADLDAEIAKQRRDAFYTPIMHEKYRRAKVSRRGTRRLDMMRQFLGPVHSRLSVLDIGCNTGFYTFHFFRQGFHATGIDFDLDHLAIAKALASLYGADTLFHACSLREFEPGKKFDIVLGLTVFWHMLGWGKFPAEFTPKELGEKLDALVGHFLFWESGRRINDEIEVIRDNSSLSHYTRLGETFATGKRREFGVFTRVPSAECRSLLRALSEQR